jgi:hypothetical protein
MERNYIKKGRDLAKISLFSLDPSSAEKDSTTAL